MTTLSYRPTLPPGTRVIDAQRHLNAKGFELTMARMGWIARRRKALPDQRA